MENNFQNITYQNDGDGIATITINRESKLNALNLDVLRELRECVRDIAKDKEFKIKGVILTGVGEKAFIAGADIAQMSGMDDRQAYEFGELGQEVTMMIEALRIPVIAAVNGFALGGGCEFAMACDFIYATKKSIFGQPEVKLGLIPGFGGTQRLARLVGRARARELIYTGRNIDVTEAERIGLVTKVFEDKEALMQGVRNTLRQICANSPMAVWHSKRALNYGVDLTLKEGLSYELEEFAISFVTKDKLEGVSAFLEKRQPHFEGK